MNKYPPESQQDRINKYTYYEKLFLGDHFDAFNIKIGRDFTRAYEEMRYVVANFAGLISKLSADMLFEEPPKINLPDGDNEWLSELLHDNKLKIQLYESALEGSYRGDALFRIRAENGRVKIEDINPAMWVPIFDIDNTRAEPEAHELYFYVHLAGVNANGDQRMGLLVERHTKGLITYRLYEIDKYGNVLNELDPVALGAVEEAEVETGIDDFLIFHVPNFRINSSFFGLSDYYDLDKLFLAINNRLTKIDNILDKHGDPILMVPPGVFDDDGKVRREAFGVIEVDTTQSSGAMPQYIVWDAKLESAFKEIDTLVELLFLMSETSTAVLGKDKDGQAESGRALKFKMLRTIAKKHRKQLYYDYAIKQMIYVAQKFAEANGFTAGDVRLSGKPVRPQIEWQDGIINDEMEQVNIETMKVDAGLTTRAEAIQRLEGITHDEATEKAEKIAKEQSPQFNVAPVLKTSSKTQNE